jgi:glutathione synthase/RimK-type ligase-like ATP-grasp enzyme
MNFPAHTYLAESKPFQLSVAARCGIPVPRTLATNDAACMRETFPGRLVIKSLDTVLLRESEECLFTYTTLGSGSTLSDEVVATAPLLAQEALEDKVDLRVTVVGEELFAVQILAGGVGVRGDWRLMPKGEVEYRDIHLSEHMNHKCKAIARHLHLSFAAIDLLQTPEGTFFIEVNPTGEWGWLVTPDRPIDRAIASWLADPPTLGLMM